MKRISIYLIVAVVSLVLPFALSSCTQDNTGNETDNDSKPMLHLTVQGAAGVTTESTARSSAGGRFDGNIPIFPGATVTTYDLATDENTITKYDDAGNLISQTRSGGGNLRSSQPQSRTSVVSDANGTLQDELLYQRVEIYYFTKTDNACFYKQTLTESTTKDFALTGGVNIPVPEAIVQLQYKEPKYSSIHCLVVVNHNTQALVSAENVLLPDETAPGMLYKSLINLKAADMASHTTQNYPGLADPSATAGHLLIMTGTIANLNFQHGSINTVQLKRMAARVAIAITTSTELESAPRVYRLMNVPALGSIFDRNTSGAPLDSYAKDELINYPWAGTGSVVPNESIDGFYQYVNENLQASLENSTRTALLLRVVDPADNAYRYYKAYICPVVAADLIKDGHIRRNYIYKVNIHIAGQGGASAETAKVIEATVDAWEAGTTTPIVQPPTKITFVEYYEKFYINQGYYFLDMFYNGAVAGDPTTAPTLHWTNKEVFGCAGQISNGIPPDNHTAYGALNKLGELLFGNINGSSAPSWNNIFKDGIRFRIDMLLAPGYGTAARYINPPRWNVPGDRVSTTFQVKLGTKIVKSSVIEFQKADLYHTVEMGGRVWLRHNLGAWTPPYLWYADSQGGYYQWGRNTPSGSVPTSGNQTYELSVPSTAVTTSYLAPYTHVNCNSGVYWHKDMMGMWSDVNYDQYNPCPAGYKVASVADYASIFPSVYVWTDATKTDFWGNYNGGTDRGFSYKYYTYLGNASQVSVSDKQRSIAFPQSGCVQPSGTWSPEANLMYWTRTMGPSRPYFWEAKITELNLSHEATSTAVSSALNIRCVKE